ncbi:MAG: hypothetical protein KKC64_14995 [Spirochaetes bacterium]|nr:hypothetical protein [Spirochaetota bacterium]
MKPTYKHHIEVYGRAEKELCFGCSSHESECASCAPSAKKRTIDLFADFTALLQSTGLAPDWSAEFLEATPDNISRNADVQRILSMAELDPVICIDGKICYLGGFSPDGLLTEIRKQVQG